MEKMTPAQLQTAREKLGLNMAEMARTLATPYRTYQEWEYGNNPIPGVAAVAVQLLLQKDAWVMRTITEKIAREYKG